MKRSIKTGLAASALMLATGAAATLATTASASAAGTAHAAHAAATPKYRFVASAADDTNITGSYYWNGDGFTGTLTIDSQVQGVIEATLDANNGTEHFSGTWYQGSNELTLTRPVAGYVQYYYYFLGGQPFSTYPHMFGGYYTTSASGSLERGTYLDSAF